MKYDILNKAVHVVRIHTGGEFYSVRYVRQWLKVIAWLPQVRFFCYTRSWRIPALKRVIDKMAAFANARLWYSCDRDAGIPSKVPSAVRLCWLMTYPEDLPPQQVDLVFRIRKLRLIPLAQLTGMRVCPDENGKHYPRPPHCESCGTCWRPLPSPLRIPLPLLTSEIPCPT